MPNSCLTKAAEAADNEFDNTIFHTQILMPSRISYAITQTSGGGIEVIGNLLDHLLHAGYTENLQPELYETLRYAITQTSDGGIEVIGDLLDHLLHAGYTENLQPELYETLRQHQPHETFPPCTTCHGALMHARQPCRSDSQCAMTAVNDTGNCPDCQLSLAECHRSACREPTRVAMSLLQALWNAAEVAQDPGFYWQHYPGVHAPDQPWTSNRQAIRKVFCDMPQSEFDTLYNACFNARPQYHVERTSNAGDYVVRCLGGRITIAEQHVDSVLLDEYNESVAALQAVSPTKNRTRLSLTDVMRMAKAQPAPTPRKSPLFPPTPEGQAAAARVRARAAPVQAPPAARRDAAGYPGAQGSTPAAGVAQQLASLQAQLNAITNPAPNGQQPPPPQTDPVLAALLSKMTDAAESLAAQRTPEKIDAGLISPMFDMQAGDLYAELLERLDMENFILHADEPRPHLVVVIEALGHNPVFPYHPRTSLPLAMDLDGFLNDNIATAAQVQKERDALKATTVASATDVSLTTGKDGLLTASQGNKPVLPTPRLRTIKTYDDLSQALDNYASHYDMVRKGAWRDKIQAHRESMRKLWLKTHLFEQQHGIFLAFERELRSNRVSRPDYNRSWRFMDENGLIGEDYNLEKGILEKHVRAVNAAIIANGLNSTGRPPKSPAGDAQKPGKDSNGKELCTNFKAGKCTRDNCKYSHGENASRGGTSRGGTKRRRERHAEGRRKRPRSSLQRHPQRVQDQVLQS